MFTSIFTLLSAIYYFASSLADGFCLFCFLMILFIVYDQINYTFVSLQPFNTRARKLFYINHVNNLCNY